MENTVNYNLKKPGQDDFYNVADFNSNADIIDGALKTHDTQLAQKATQIDLSNHLGDLITDSNGVHGLKIESGVWTPVMVGGTTAGTFTGTAIGAYKLIGKQVTCYFRISGTIVGASGELNLRGLPFTPISGELSGIMTRNNFFADRILAINNTGSIDRLRISQGGTSLLTVTTESTALDFWGSIDYFIN